LLGRRAFVTHFARYRGTWQMKDGQYPKWLIRAFLCSSISFKRLIQ